MTNYLERKNPLSGLTPEELAKRDERIAQHNALIAQCQAAERKAKSVVKDKNHKPKPVNTVHPVAAEIRASWAVARKGLAENGANAQQYRERYIKFVVERVFGFDEYAKCVAVVRKALGVHGSEVVKRAVETLMIESSRKHISTANRYRFLDKKCRDVKAEMVATGELKFESDRGA